MYGVKWDRIGWDGIGWDGTGWDVGESSPCSPSQQQLTACEGEDRAVEYE